MKRLGSGFGSIPPDEAVIFEDRTKRLSLRSAEGVGVGREESLQPYCKIRILFFAISTSFSFFNYIESVKKST